MVNAFNSSLGLSILTQARSGALGLDASALQSWIVAKAGVGTVSNTGQADPNAPLAPMWTPGISPSNESFLRRALEGKSFFDTGAKLFSDLAATGDYRNLFALYAGLSSMQALTRAAEDDTIAATERGRIEAHFARGLSELRDFFAKQTFQDLRVAQGDQVDTARTTLALPSKSEDYLTGVIHRGSLAAEVSGLADDAAFEIVATSATGTERRVAIDLSEMGTLPRSLGAVVSFINGKLSAAGAASRLEAVDQSPKTSVVVAGGRTITSRYTGAKQYALKVDVRAGERVAFEAAAPQPAFYAVGQVANGARLVKLQDVGGAAGEPAWLTRPEGTIEPIGAHVATGWLGPGAPYSAAPAGAYEQRTNALMSGGANTFETALRAAGEAALTLDFADGRKLSVSTAWRSDDLEAWRVRSGEDGDRAILDDLAERLTQLLHEQGVAAGVEVWESGTERGLSLLSGDFVSVSGFTISGKAATLTPTDPVGMVGGLRDGVFARRFEAAGVALASDLFVGDQTLTLTMAHAMHAVAVSGGAGGIDAATLVERLNEELREQGVAAAASLYDDNGALALRIDALHDMIGVSASLNGTSHGAVLQAPGAWASGGLPSAGAGQPFAAGVRTTNVTGGAPLSTYTAGIDLEIVVATPTGNETVAVSVSAVERANDPDPAPGEWSSVFQDRLDAALNAAGVYVDAQGADLTTWVASEAAGHRIVSISINGAALSLESATPALALGGAFSVERSFTSAEAATGASDDVSALVSDQNVAVSFATVWGARTVAATLDPGDPRTLESAALRLNAALAAQGYDLGVEAVALSGSGAGLRIVAGASHSVRGVSQVSLGGAAFAVTLDPIDSASQADDPVGAGRVAERADRGASIIETSPEGSAFTAPSANSSAWFPGRAFDVAIAGGSRAAAARAVAAAADGSVYVLANLEGDSSAGSIKGARDVALLKYDSAGKLASTHILGAAQSASGFALAVSAEGKVAVAGAVEGVLSNAASAAGGADSFVSLFDTNGAELWTARRGATSNDEARALAFARDGSVIVAGKTDSALGASIALGGADGYARGFSASGAELFTRQFGTGGDDAATALLVRDDGAGGMEIFTGGVENSRGVLRRFTYTSAAGIAAGATRDIGYFQTGAINTLAADGTSLYVGGEVGADRLSLGATARAAVAAGEGFVARLNSDLATTNLDRASYLGSAQDDTVRSLAIVAGNVYAAGVAGGAIGGQGTAKTKNAFLARLDSEGAAAWVRTFNSAGGRFDLASIAVDSSGASPLDVLGLPRGIVVASDPAVLTSRSALRVGDEFRIGADGRRLTSIKVGASDTLASLVVAINRAIGGAGRAEIVRENGADRLQISARGDNAVRIEAGREGRDGLAALGLTPGLVARNLAGAGRKAFGLGLVAGDLKLDSKTAIARSKAELSAALSIVRLAYDALLHPNAKELTAEEKALEERRANAGPAPAYYTAQLANYRAALARLGG